MLMLTMIMLGFDDDDVVLAAPLGPFWVLATKGE